MKNQVQDIRNKFKTKEALQMSLEALIRKQEQAINKEITSLFKLLHPTFYGFSYMLT